MAKSVGVEEKQTGKQCAYCKEKFGAQEFYSHLWKFGNDKIFCHACQNTNFIYTTDNRKLRILFIAFSTFVGLVIAFPGLFSIALGIYQSIFTNLDPVMSPGRITGFGITGLIVGRYLMHLFDWVDATIMPEEDQPVMQFVSGKSTIQSDEQ